jgi:hypothetical protein
VEYARYNACPFVAIKFCPKEFSGRFLRETRAIGLAQKPDGPGRYTVGAALYQAGAGEADAMFEALEGALRTREENLVSIRCLRLFDCGDPRLNACPLPNFVKKYLRKTRERLN